MAELSDLEIIEIARFLTKSGLRLKVITRTEIVIDLEESEK